MYFLKVIERRMRKITSFKSSGGRWAREWPLYLYISIGLLHFVMKKTTSNGW